MFEQFFERKLTRREAIYGTLVVTGITAGVILSPFSSVFNPTSIAETPIHTAPKAVKDVADIYEDSKKDLKDKNLVPNDILNMAALSLTLAALCKSGTGPNIIDYYEQIRNRRSLENPSIAVSIATTGINMGWNSEVALENHDRLSNLGARYNPIRGAQLLSVAAAEDDMNKISNLYTSLDRQLLYSDDEVEPLIISADLVSNDSAKLLEHYSDINSIIAGSDHNFAAEILVLAEYNQGDWKRVGGDYTNITMKETELREDRNGVLSLIFAGIIDWNKQDEVWKIYDHYTKDLKYNSYLASRFTLLSALRPSALDRHGRPTRASFVVSDIITNWSLYDINRVKNSKYSLI